MARALDSVFAFNPVRPNELAAWLEELGADTLRQQARVPADLRRRSTPPITPAQWSAPPPPPPPPPPSPPPWPPRFDVATSFLSALSPAHQKLAILTTLFVAGSAFGMLFAIAISTALGITSSHARAHAYVTDNGGAQTSSAFAIPTTEESP